MDTTPRLVVERISESGLASLVAREMRRRAASGRAHIRNPEAFAQHLVEVATRAEVVARLLARVVPPDEAPDPIACFVAGAWHDGGKISSGNDYHELTSATEILEQGLEWGLVQGDVPDAEPVLRRAARAVLPDFALYEQWQAPYIPTSGDRKRFAPLRSFIAGRLLPWGDERSLDRQLFLPYSMDALVVMYADMTAGDPDRTERHAIANRADPNAPAPAEPDADGPPEWWLDGENRIDNLHGFNDGHRLRAGRRLHDERRLEWERRLGRERRAGGERRTGGERRETGFNAVFKRRWVDLARRAQAEDPALSAILPAVRPRIYDGCALLNRFLKNGYDEVALRGFRTTYC